MKRIVIPALLIVSAALGVTSNSITAVSSASKKYNVTGGSAYADSAVIKYYCGYDNGETFFSFGEKSGAYTDTVKFSNAEGDNTSRITGLKGGKTYYYDFWTRYKGKDRHSCLGSFTTPTGATGVIDLKTAMANGFSAYPTENGVTLKLAANSSYSIQLSTIQGRTVIATNGVSDGHGSASVTYPPLSHGIYLLSVTVHGITVSDKILIK